MKKEVVEKKPRELERIMKGVASHRRISVLRLLEKRPELSLVEICEELNMNLKTGSEHIRKLAITGAVLKRREWTTIRHALSPRGKTILKFLRTLE